jgi:hypothetical protein
VTDQPTVTIQLTFVDADEQQRDPATVGETARKTADDLRGKGYTVQPAYTGAKGGDVFTIAAQLGQNIVDNKELLEALLDLALPILTFLLGRQAERDDKEKQTAAPPQQTQQQSVNISITINQATAQVESADLDGNERLLRKLLAVQPDLIDTVTPQSTPHIEVHVPRKPQRRRR